MDLEGRLICQIGSMPRKPEWAGLPWALPSGRVDSGDGPFGHNARGLSGPPPATPEIRPYP